jgi:putative nucleotidyltransferase with HDIG domain
MNDNKINPDLIKKVVLRVLDLPTLSTVVSKMLRMVDSRRTSADTLARLISTDQALTAKLLKAANSAYYGYSREISTVNMAIVVLGFDRVKELILSLSVLEAFKGSNRGAAGFDAVKFWEHSAACGVAARMLSKASGSRYSGEAFVAGLLHDMGKMILNIYFDTGLVEVLKIAGNDLEQAEMEVLGVRHGEIGAWVAEKWNLPGIISDTIRYHHEPWNAEVDKAFVAHVTVADTLCHLTKIGNSAGRTAAPRYDDRLWNVFDSASVPIDETDLDRLQEDFLAEYGRSEAYVSVVRDDDDGLM